MSIEDKKIPTRQIVTIDCIVFGDFVEQVYGKEYSAVPDPDKHYFAGNGSTITIDLPQWEYDQTQDWTDFPQDVDEEFDRWYAQDNSTFGGSGYNPDPEVMFLKLRKDGYEVPDSFDYYIWW